MKFLKLVLPLIILSVIIISCDINDAGDPAVTEGSDIKLVINEFMASNDAAVYVQATDDYPDWFEIYNYGTEAVDIGGMYVSDSKNDYKKAQIPTTNSALTTVQPGGFLVIYCDKMPTAGPLHVDFSLSGGGEEITLTESNGLKVIDELTYEAQTTDVSYGRNPDGSETWEFFTSATPGESNNGSVSSFSPVISGISITPETIEAGNDVTISANVTDDDGDLATVTITYNSTTVAMTADGDVYSTTISSVTDATVYEYFITATDEAANVTISDTLSFQVGYIAPVLFINEFLASNDSNYFDETTQDYPDWIEIYNPGTEAVDIGGYYITDGLDNLTTWQIPTTYPDSTTIPASGFLLLLADKTTEAGILHVNIKLSGGGEQIGLTAPNGTTIIDSLTFGAQVADTSYGRNPDGSDNWQLFPTPTPGTSNN